MAWTKRVTTWGGFALALAVWAAPASGQIRPGVPAVEAGDQIAPVLAKQREQIVAQYAKDGRIVPQFEAWVKVESPAAAKLFPGLRFASIEWNESLAPGTDGGAIGLAAGLQTTIAIDPKAGAVIAELSGHGNYEAFGEMLAKWRAPLRDQVDATTIWAAFCAIHHKHWMDQPHERVSDAEWRLGRYSYDQTVASDGGFKTVVTKTHYKLVRVDPATGRVTGWKSRVDSANERKVPVPVAERGR
ncbi:MAG TPA: hypothetical protein VEA69_11455 [Tepidisphaeraceae bacterium]|nr:hypothetical protein [Tepidisphaeraceae bacterium]